MIRTYNYELTDVRNDIYVIKVGSGMCFRKVKPCTPVNNCLESMGAEYSTTTSGKITYPGRIHVY